MSLNSDEREPEKVGSVNSVSRQTLSGVWKQECGNQQPVKYAVSGSYSDDFSRTNPDVFLFFIFYHWALSLGPWPLGMIMSCHVIVAIGIPVF